MSDIETQENMSVAMLAEHIRKRQELIRDQITELTTEAADLGVALCVFKRFKRDDASENDDKKSQEHEAPGI